MQQLETRCFFVPPGVFFGYSEDYFLRGMRPRRILVCGVSYPAGFWSAGSHTPQDFGLRGLIPRGILVCGVSDHANKTTKKFAKIRRGMIPRRILFCGV